MRIWQESWGNAISRRSGDKHREISGKVPWKILLTWSWGEFWSISFALRYSYTSEREWTWIFLHPLASGYGPWWRSKFPGTPSLSFQCTGWALPVWRELQEITAGSRYRQWNHREDIEVVGAPRRGRKGFEGVWAKRWHGAAHLLQLRAQAQPDCRSFMGISVCSPATRDPNSSSVALYSAIPGNECHDWALCLCLLHSVLNFCCSLVFGFPKSPW